MSWRAIVAEHVRRGHRGPYDLMAGERRSLVAEFIRTEGVPDLNGYVRDFSEREARLSELYELTAHADPYHPDPATHAIGWRFLLALEAAAFGAGGIGAEFRRLVAAEERAYPSDEPEALPPVVGR